MCTVDCGVHRHLPVDVPGSVCFGDEPGRDLVPGAVLNRLWRFHAVCHGPNVSGRSRQATPVRSRYGRLDHLTMITERTSSLSFQRTASAARSGSIERHSAVQNSTSVNYPRAAPGIFGGHVLAAFAQPRRMGQDSSR